MIPGDTEEGSAGRLGRRFLVMHGFGQVPGIRQRMRILQRKERKIQGIGRAEEKDGKAEMPVPPAARAPESAGQAL
jgi:hypothetical protein